MIPDPTASTRWHSFFKGWQDACAAKPRRPEFTGSSNPDVRDCYENGFEAGVGDRRKTQMFATLQYGYSPTILREITPAPPHYDQTVPVEYCEHGMPKGYLCTKCVEENEKAQASRKPGYRRVLKPRGSK